MWFHAAAKNNAKKLQTAFALHQQGKLTQAEGLYQEILQSDPRHFDALQLLAAIAEKNKNAVYALELFDRAFKINSHHSALLNNRGNALRALKRTEEALESYERALKIEPDFVDALYNRGLALQDMKRTDEAMESYNRVIQMKPDHAGVYYNCGSILRDLNYFEEALKSYDRVLEIIPVHVYAHYNRGFVLQNLNRFEEALESYERVFQLKPDDYDYVDVYYNRGTTLQCLNRFEEALQSYEDALKIKPNYAAVLSDRGLALQCLNRPKEALESYAHAVRLQPDYVIGCVNESLCRLLLGDFTLGWQKFEWRWESSQLSAFRRRFTQALWLGEESLQGKTILLHAEQGFGDTLQFCRYASLVAAQGAKVLLEAPVEMQLLLATLEGVSSVLSMGETLPAFDYHCPLMSLPLAFKTELDTIPANIPYLRADINNIMMWREWLQGVEKGHLKVGLAWAGRSRKETQNIDFIRTNARRSMHFAQLSPLGHVEGVQFYSLQKGEGAEEARQFPIELPLIDYTAEFNDFSDTAAFIMNLDLVISVDTSVVHLAGALGKPVWLLNRFDTCWRWLLDREESPWYPTMRIFRQAHQGDWDSVIQRVKEELFKIKLVKD